MDIRHRIEEEVTKYSRKYGHFPLFIVLSKKTYEDLLSEWPQFKDDNRLTIGDVHINVKSDQEVDAVLTSSVSENSLISDRWLFGESL